MLDYGCRDKFFNLSFHSFATKFVYPVALFFSVPLGDTSINFENYLTHQSNAVPEHPKASNDNSIGKSDHKCTARSVFSFALHLLLWQRLLHFLPDFPPCLKRRIKTLHNNINSKLKCSYFEPADKANWENLPKKLLRWHKSAFCTYLVLSALIQDIFDKTAFLFQYLRVHPSNPNPLLTAILTPSIQLPCPRRVNGLVLNVPSATIHH